MIETRWRKLKRAAVKHRADLVTSTSDRCRRADDFGSSAAVGAKRIDGDLIDTGHGSERP